MSDQSPILSLPYIQAAQAQKHVTHNEALRRLDVLVQATVLAADLVAPPAEGQTGDRYLVPTDGEAEWLGRDGQIAVREVSHWTFLAPQKGWQVRVLDSLALLVFDGTAWTDAGGGTTPAGPADTLGINTAADATNRLAVAAPATLLTHEGAGHQVKINKSSAGETGSLLFQTNWSGRAEMGCTGTDDFTIKVTEDGTAWHDALRTDGASGAVRFPSGVAVPNRVAVNGRWFCEPDNRWVGFSDSNGAETSSFARNAGTAAEPGTDWRTYGPILTEGSVVTGFQGLFRRVNSDVTGFDLRVFAQYGTPGAAWNSTANTTRDLLLSRDGVTLNNSWTSVIDATIAYTVPEDAFLLVYLRPTGTRTSRQYITSGFSVDVITAA